MLPPTDSTDPRFTIEIRPTSSSSPSSTAAVPSIFTLTNADGLRFILHAIEQTKSTDARTLADFLHKLKDFPGITGPITLDETGERISSLFYVYEVQPDGAYKIVYGQR